MRQQLRRIIDWRLILSMAFLLLVISLVQSSFATAKERDHLLIQADRDHSAQVVARQQASAERQRLLDGQKRMEDKYDALLMQNRRILAYLSGLGIPVPPSLLDVSGDGNDTGGGHDGHNGSSSSKGSGKQSPPKSGSTVTNDKAAGRSGKGRRAGRKDHQGHRGAAAKSGSHGKAKGR